MNQLQHEQYTGKGGIYQQLTLPISENILIDEHEPVYVANAQLEELDYRKLYQAYSPRGRKSAAEPRIMLKLLVYGYMCGIYSTRKLELACRKNIDFIWLLQGEKVPDYSSFSRFRSGKAKEAVEDLFYQFVKRLAELEETEYEEVFIDGTKIESAANRYTFVWRKAVTKHQARFLQKTALLVGDIIQRQELKPLWKKQVKKKHVKKILKKLRAKANEESLEFVSGRGHIKTQLQRDIEALEAALEKLKEYEKKLHICADRGSYAKTDPDATFMHMKDDHMRNGQLKPAYNLQHAVNSGFIVAAGIFPNPTDVMTLKPFLNQMEDDLSFAFERIVCDAGYESEENLSFLRAKGIEAYIKPANYEQIGTKKFAKEIGRKENMRYDKEQDCYLCHNGKEIKRSGSRRVKTASGYIREETQYACSECGGCPYKEKCMSGKNWKKPLEERYKKLTVSRLFEELREEEYRRIHSEEGKKLRMNRSIQAEGGFADIKGDSGFTRFLCKGNENVFAEYILYAMAHNLGWLHSRIQNDKLDLHLYELKEDETEAA